MLIKVNQKKLIKRKRLKLSTSTVKQILGEGIKDLVR